MSWFWYVFIAIDKILIDKKEKQNIYNVKNTVMVKEYTNENFPKILYNLIKKDRIFQGKCTNVIANNDMIWS